MRVLRDARVLPRPRGAAVGGTQERAVISTSPSVVGITEVDSGQAVLGRVWLDDPGVAAVGGLNYVPIAAYHPARSLVKEEDVEEVRGDRHVKAVPGQPAVCRTTFVAVLDPAHDDRSLGVQRGHSLEQLCGRIELLLPGRAPVLGAENVAIIKRVMIADRPAVQVIGHVDASKRYVLVADFGIQPGDPAVSCARSLAAVAIRGPGVVLVKSYHVKHFVDAAFRPVSPGSPAVTAGDDYAFGTKVGVSNCDAVLRVHEVHLPQGQHFGRNIHLLPGDAAVGSAHHILANAPPVVGVGERRPVDPASSRQGLRLPGSSTISGPPGDIRRDIPALVIVYVVACGESGGKTPAEPTVIAVVRASGR